MNWALGPGDFLVLTLLASGPLFPPIEWWRFRLPTIGGLPECSAPRSGLESGMTSWHDAPMFLLFYVYPFLMPIFAFVPSWFIRSHNPLTVPIVYQLFTHSLSPLFFHVSSVEDWQRYSLRQLVQSQIKRPKKGKREMLTQWIRKNWGDSEVTVANYYTKRENDRSQIVPNNQVTEREDERHNVTII